jgi:2-keto-4-pentenoate hydratase/2-oxohepta-3-ene-1,7-dioic acid hydratase in catechol pathway
MSMTAIRFIGRMIPKLAGAMRLVTYERHRSPRAGVVRDGGVVDLWDALGGEPPEGPTVGALLRHRGIQAAQGVGGPAVATLDDVRLLPPVTDPEKIVCMGLNYRSHAEEAGLEAPETPTFFAKFRNALAPPGAEVPLPRYSEKVDYEAEVAFVIGRRAKDVSEGDALDHVAGYTLLNDLSARDWQFKTPQWQPGKVFDGSAPSGPALVTPDEAGPPDAIEISLTLNGETLQSASTADLIHSIPELVAYLSKLMTLEPGDIVSTGTPAGVGSVREPRVWLKPGDDIVIESPQLGRLETRIGEPVA